MRVLILPSWCPTAQTPHAGSFFVEQAEALAHATPHWDITLMQHALHEARMPLRPWHWPRFFWHCLTRPRLRTWQRTKQLRQCDVYVPYLPCAKGSDAWEVNVHALAAHAEKAIHAMGGVDVIYALASYPAGAACALLNKKHGTPYVMAEHLGPFPPPQLCNSDGTPHPVLQRAYASAQRVAAVSNALAAAIQQAGLRSDVQVIPNFLPSEYGALNTKARKGALRFLAVGTPSHAKGTDVLLAAFAQLEADAELHMVGTGAEDTRYKMMAQQLGISPRVKWHGNIAREAMPAHYAACDALVVASQSETFSVVIIEALAHGKPVIATQCGGPQDTVNAQNGELVPVGDVPALSAAMARMVAGYARFEPESLRRDMQQRFSAEAVMPQLQQFIAGV